MHAGRIYTEKSRRAWLVEDLGIKVGNYVDQKAGYFSNCAVSDKAMLNLSQYWGNGIYWSLKKVESVLHD